ncbi:MAG TPA: hypothetical protein VMT51_00815 [Dongiaceae bacterium]|nr:hypothetical protein [Dongiaceae bacterium]
MNDPLPRRYWPLRAIFGVAAAAFLFPLGTFLSAQPETLEDCVERLAHKAAAMPHERRMTLVWVNHAGFSDERAERLRLRFVTQMETAQVHFVQGEAAPALRVAMERTPTQIVFAATVPAEGSTNVAIEEIARTSAGSDEPRAQGVRLEKELLWRQETRILSAAITQDEQGRVLLVLDEDALRILREYAGEWELEESRNLPGPKQAPRGARGQILVTEGVTQHASVMLPGRRCDVSLTQAGGANVTCVSGGGEWPAGRLLAKPDCGAQTWWLRSSGSDWIAEDRLQLRGANAGKDAGPAAELSLPGPVISIAAGDGPENATATVRNLTTGNYEVYSIALACGN